MDYLHDDTESSKDGTFDPDMLAAIEAVAAMRTPEDARAYRIWVRENLLEIDAEAERRLAAATSDAERDAIRNQADIARGITIGGITLGDKSKAIMPPAELEHTQREMADSWHRAQVSGETTKDYREWVNDRLGFETAPGRPLPAPRFSRLAHRLRARASTRRETSRRPARPARPVRAANLLAASTTKTTRAETDSGGDGPPPEPPSRGPRCPAILAAPVLVSNKSASEVLGPDWSSAKFIAFVRRKPVRHAWDGRICRARLSDVLEALGLADAPAAPKPAWSPEDVISALRAPARTGGRR